MSMKPRDKAVSKSASERTPEAELDQKALEKVTGGKGCAGGQHIKEGGIRT